MDLPGSLKDPSTWQQSGHSDRDGSEISESEVIHPTLDEDCTGTPSAAPTEIPSQERNKHYPPRTCRICLESVSPTFHPPSINLPTFLQSSAHVVYESPEPELGRLLRPCKCKGSSRYVHEGCLNTWRHADPSYGRRNYWECPTCRFRYRLERMTWSRWISSTATQIILTIGILLFTIFLLGFIADPIINLYFDPLDVILDEEYWEPDHILNTPPSDIRSSWTEHFLKGLASLGVLSFFRGVFAFSPYVRGSISLGSRGRSTGRTRLSSTTWLVVLIGICSFLWAVYKGVRAWARRTLEKASERVLDVSVNGPDEDEDLGTHQEVNIKED